MKKMKELYPNKNFIIIGEIGSMIKIFNSQDTLLTDDGKAIPISPRGSLKRPFEWIAGFIAVGENTYIAAVKSIFPAFASYLKR